MTVANEKQDELGTEKPREDFPQNDGAQVKVVEDKHDDLDKEKVRQKLADLRKKPINYSSVVEMSSEELAAALGAYMVKYEVEMAQEFEDMRCRLKELFMREWIQGGGLAGKTRTPNQIRKISS